MTLIPGDCISRSGEMGALYNMNMAAVLLPAGRLNCKYGILNRDR